MKVRTTVLGVIAFLGMASALAGCGSDATPPGDTAPPTQGASTASDPTTGSGSASDSGSNTGSDSPGLTGITFPPGAVVSELGKDQKHYEVKGMTLEAVKTFFEDQMISAGYTRAQEANASRFYDKGSKRIQVTWSDQQGTIRGVVRVTRA